MIKKIIFLSGFVLGFSFLSNLSYAEKENNEKINIPLNLSLNIQDNPFIPIENSNYKDPDPINNKISTLKSKIEEVKNNKKEEKKPKIEYLRDEYIVRSGNYLNYFLNKSKIDKDIIKEVIYNTKNIKKIANLKVGQKIIIEKKKDNTLNRIILELNDINTVQLVKNKNSFEVKEVDYEYIITNSYIEGVIDGSLYQSANKMGLSKEQVNDLISIFEWTIDFNREVKKGDKFYILFEEKYVNDKKVGIGDILSASFQLSNDSYNAFLFKDKQGIKKYYNENGESLEKAFIRNPIEFARISSKFNLNRFHPVHKKVRPHKGVDYAANTGTPIRSTGSGTIKFIGKKGGYGNVIIIDHGNNYTTLYAHMSKFKKGLKYGSKINQKDIIGYVGATGTATGPHLHYEFQIAGMHKDPLKVKLPDNKPIPIKYASSFKETKNKYISLMNDYKKINKIIYTAKNEIK